MNSIRNFDQAIDMSTQFFGPSRPDFLTGALFQWAEIRHA
jgi:hypothetical protein